MLQWQKSYQKIPMDEVVLFFNDAVCIVIFGNLIISGGESSGCSATPNMTSSPNDSAHPGKDGAAGFGIKNLGFFCRSMMNLLSNSCCRC
jgi:hypothetical protein